MVIKISKPSKIIFFISLLFSVLQADGLNNEMLTKAVVKLIKQQTYIQNQANKALKKSNNAISSTNELYEKTEELREQIVTINDNIEELKVKIETSLDDNNTNEITALKNQIINLEKSQKTFIDSLNLLSNKIGEKKVTINADVIDGSLSDVNKKALRAIIEENTKDKNLTLIVK